MIEIKMNNKIENILEKRLEEQKQLNKLEGEQWFRNPLVGGMILGIISVLILSI